LLASAHGDEIHEGVRSDLSPEVGQMIRIARGAGAFHAARSGAGPAVLALVGPDVSTTSYLPSRRRDSMRSSRVSRPLV